MSSSTPIADHVVALQATLGDPSRVEVGDSVRALHARDPNHDDGPLPDVVVFPENAGEVSRILAYAQANRLAVTPFGVGSSLEGHVLPLEHGISVDMSQMNRILEVRNDDRIAIVEPGVLRHQLNRRLGQDGLQFPIDPGADASLGGMASTNASGTTAVRFGAMRQQVLGLQVVLAGGQVIRTGGPVVKSSAGYNLTSLFVGAEGTLGIITELTIRVYAIPEHLSAGRAVFNTVEAACEAATALVAIAATINRCELVDDVTVSSFNRHFGTSYEEEPTLFLEFGGSEAAVAADVELAREILGEQRARLTFESTTEGRNNLWAIRHRVGEANTANWPGRRIKGTDVTVPVSRLAEAVALTRADLESVDCPSMIMGHVGDGNYHVVLLVDPASAAERDVLAHVERRQVEIALELGGTCTGEHGIGFGKIPFLELEHPDGLPVMRSIKAALDPHWLMNPGKIFSRTSTL